jgi:hypothetical protein
MSEDCSVSEFLSKFPLGFARPNRYKIEFQMPPGIPDWGGYMNEESQLGRITALGLTLNQKGAINISCHTCSMPSRTMMAYPHTQHSAPFNVPYSQQYEPVTFGFYAHNTLRARQFFDIWQTAVVNINDNSVNFYEEYTNDIMISQIDRNGEPTYQVKLYGCYPISIGDVQYSYATNNQVQNITVTMAFKLWKAEHDTTEIILY